MTDGRTADGRLLAVARRYEPAVVAVVMVLVALLVLPRVSSDGVLTASPALGIAQGVATTTTTTSVLSATAPLPTFAALPSTVPPRPAASSATSRPPRTTTTTAPVTPLRITESGWSGSDGGSPVAGADVPDGSLPVSMRLGAPDRRSYVMVSGTAPLLELVVVDDPVGSRFTDAAVVWLCPITQGGWNGEPAMSDDDAPIHACEAQVIGRPSDDGWTFDLSMLPERNRTNGFALVAGDGAADFQILFSDTSAG